MGHWGSAVYYSEGGAQGISRGLRLYFTVYPNLSHNKDIINFSKLYIQSVFRRRAVLEELILRIGLAAGVHFPVLRSR